MIHLKSSLIAAGLGAMTMATTFAQGTAFTYQGRLNAGTNPATGAYNLMFSLFSASTGNSLIAGPYAQNAVAISNGLFTTTVDFGPGVFIGASNWLQIAVATNGSTAFTNLTPRQQLTPAPYAVFAESVNATSLVGSVPDGSLSANVPLLNAGNTYTGLNVYNNLVKVVGPVSNNGYFGFLEEDTSDTGDFWILTKWDSVGNKRFSIYDGNGVTPVVLQERGGNVGIGTNSPNTALQVAGTVSATAFSGDGSGLTGLRATNLVGSVPAANLSGVALLGGGNAYTGNQTVTGGNVGFGTTAPQVGFEVDSSVYAQPAAQFDVANCGGPCGQTDYQEAVRLWNQNGNGQVGLGFLVGATSFNSNTIPDAWIGTQYAAYGNGNDFKIATRPSATGTNLTDRIYVNGTTGNLGIGTNAPSARLEVNGSAQVDGTVVLNNSGANNSLSFAGGGIQVAGAGLNTPTVAFVQRAAITNLYSGDGTIINNPFCNNNPNAILIVTPNYNPGFGVQTYNNHPIGVYYAGANWIIFNEDTAPMVTNSAFNVLVMRP